MFFGLALMTYVVPLSIGNYELTWCLSKPYIVQATIDSARIIGLPSSKAAKAYALKIQSPDPILKQITVMADPVSDRKLFFRNYFQ